MTVINHDQWGWNCPDDVPAPGIVFYDAFVSFFPRAPGCGTLQTGDPFVVRPLKYWYRTHSSMDEDEKIHVKASWHHDSENHKMWHLPLSVGHDWDHSSADAHTQNMHPDNGGAWAAQWDENICLPCDMQSFKVWNDSVTITDKCIDGFEIGVTWDETSCPSEDVPIWDWSDPDISNSQMPGSSVVVMKSLIETYNRIIYALPWRISVALPSDDRPLP